MSILSKIQTGKIGRAQKVVIYAPEGFGKSTIAGQFPNPLFFDIEGGTSQLNVARIGRESLPTTVSIQQAIEEVVKDKPCSTLVIDTADWLEQMAVDSIVADAKNSKIAGIEDFGYGKGYTLLKEKFTIVLSWFDSLISAGINVVLLAHSIVRKFEPPDGAGAYDRYELKLSKHVAPLVKEWADAVLFGNWRTQIRERDKNDSGQQFKGVGGKERKMFATRCATHDAKNRHGLNDEEPWSIDTIKKAFTSVGAPWNSPAETVQPAKAAAIQQPSMPENVKNAGEVAKEIVAELKPLDVEFARICEPHSDAVTEYMHGKNKLLPGETWRNASEDYKQRVLKNPAGFIKVVLAGGAQ